MCPDGLKMGGDLYIRHRKSWFKFRDVEADGNCMYHCLAKCPATPLSSIDDIRKVLAKMMRKPSEHLMNFFVEYHKSDENPEPSLEKWQDAVLQDSEWGSNFESSLFGAIYGVDVRIVTNSPAGLEESDTRTLLEMYEIDSEKMIPKDAPTFYLYLHKHNQPQQTTHKPNHFAILDPVDHEPPEGSVIYIPPAEEENQSVSQPSRESCSFDGHSNNSTTRNTQERRKMSRPSSGGLQREVSQQQRRNDGSEGQDIHPVGHEPPEGSVIYNRPVEEENQSHPSRDSCITDGHNSTTRNTQERRKMSRPSSGGLQREVSQQQRRNDGSEGQDIHPVGHEPPEGSVNYNRPVEEENQSHPSRDSCITDGHNSTTRNTQERRRVPRASSGSLQREVSQQQRRNDVSEGQDIHPMDNEPPEGSVIYNRPVEEENPSQSSRESCSVDGHNSTTRNTQERRRVPRASSGSLQREVSQQQRRNDVSEGQDIHPMDNEPPEGSVIYNRPVEEENPSQSSRESCSVDGHNNNTRNAHQRRRIPRASSGSLQREVPQQQRRNDVPEGQDNMLRRSGLEMSAFSDVLSEVPTYDRLEPKKSEDVRNTIQSRRGSMEERKNWGTAPSKTAQMRSHSESNIAYKDATGREREPPLIRQGSTRRVSAPNERPQQESKHDILEHEQSRQRKGTRVAEADKGVTRRSKPESPSEGGPERTLGRKSDQNQQHDTSMENHVQRRNGQHVVSSNTIKPKRSEGDREETRRRAQEDYRMDSTRDPRRTPRASTTAEEGATKPKVVHPSRDGGNISSKQRYSRSDNTERSDRSALSSKSRDSLRNRNPGGSSHRVERAHPPDLIVRVPEETVSSNGSKITSRSKDDESVASRNSQSNRNGRMPMTVSKIREEESVFTKESKMKGELDSQNHSRSQDTGRMRRREDDFSADQNSVVSSPDLTSTGGMETRERPGCVRTPLSRKNSSATSTSLRRSSMSFQEDPRSSESKQSLQPEVGRDETLERMPRRKSCAPGVSSSRPSRSPRPKSMPIQEDTHHRGRSPGYDDFYVDVSSSGRPEGQDVRRNASEMDRRSKTESNRSHRSTDSGVSVTSRGRKMNAEDRHQRPGRFSPGPPRSSREVEMRPPSPGRTDPHPVQNMRRQRSTQQEVPVPRHFELYDS